mmetsp:Transcript_33549/g.94208  ORF Transcript_33549/g.94208 Transcript_33549/m.94208 type:complete len:80 (+) Transcript_33549:182-421(+)
MESLEGKSCILCLRLRSNRLMVRARSLRRSFGTAAEELCTTPAMDRPSTTATQRRTWTRPRHQRILPHVVWYQSGHADL